MNPIAALIIVKNEEKTIAQALHSIKPFTSQIVVVDTGSSDNTVQICTQFGADVYFKKWNDDFSEIRNFGLDHIVADWVISLDADEIIDNDTLDTNLHLLKETNVGGLNVKIINYLDDDLTNYSTHRYTRIYRSHPEIRYRQTVHEQIRPSIEELNMEIIDTEIKIFHYGYINTPDSKKQRNEKLLELELQKSPGDPWVKYHLAETKFAQNDFNTAAQLFTESLNDGNLQKEQSEISRIRLGQIALRFNKFKDVIALMNFSIANPDWEGLRLHLLATAYFSLQDYDNALQLYKKVEQIRSPLVNITHIQEAILALENLKI